MIERKLTIGSHIDIGDITKIAPGGAPGEMSQGTEARTILRSHKVGKFGSRVTQRDVVVGENLDKTHRNFIWLPYAVNQINYATSQGKDVLSGVFTGCWMIRYTNNGSVRVAHVSTPNASAAWNALAATNAIQIQQGFKPSDFLDLKKATGGTGDFGLEMFGLVTDTGDLFTVGLQRRDKEGVNIRRVAFVAPATSKTPEELALLPLGGADMT